MLTRLGFNFITTFATVAIYHFLGNDVVQGVQHESCIRQTRHVAAGIDHSFAVTSHGTAYAWGFSSNYRSGLGTEDTVETPTLVGDVGKIITAAQCGGQVSVLVGPGGLEGEAEMLSYTDKVLAGPAGMEKYKLLASWAELGTQ